MLNSLSKKVIMFFVLKVSKLELEKANYFQCIFFVAVFEKKREKKNRRRSNNLGQPFEVSTNIRTGWRGKLLLFFCQRKKLQLLII
jgi:hypothetical protein